GLIGGTNTNSPTPSASSSVRRSLRCGEELNPRLEAEVDWERVALVGGGEIAPRRAHHAVGTDARVVRSDRALLDLRRDAPDLAPAEGNPAARKHERNRQTDRHARRDKFVDLEPNFDAL